jgi:hypothetical protein
MPNEIEFTPENYLKSRFSSEQKEQYLCTTDSLDIMTEHLLLINNMCTDAFSL